jgi:hypothetical protein
LNKALDGFEIKNDGSEPIQYMLEQKKISLKIVEEFCEKPKKVIEKVD